MSNINWPEAPERLKVYYDAEFTGLQRDTKFISIGMVCENHNCFYAEFTDYGDPQQLDPWLKDNVLAHMILKPGALTYEHEDSHSDTFCLKADSKQIRDSLLVWLAQQVEGTSKKIQFFTDCYAYDWMLLNDLLCENHNALSLPKYLDYIPIDLSTMLYQKNIDPDIYREKFAGIRFNELDMDLMGAGLDWFKWDGIPKHNSLWDAYVAKVCFERLEVME